MVSTDTKRSVRALAGVTVVVVAGTLGAACGSGASDAQPRSQNAGAYTATQAPMENNFGTPAHDMPGGSRWSATPKGK